MSIFTSSTNSFRSQLSGETTILVIRKHWLIFISPAIMCFILAGAPFLVYFLIYNQPWYFFVSSLFWFIAALYYLLIWDLFFYNLMIYSLNTIVVTSKRIIETEQKGFFNYNVDELEIKKIQDISVAINGVFAAFFDYGVIEIQSAGSQNKFLFHYIPHPQKVKNAIMEIAGD